MLARQRLPLGNPGRHEQPARRAGLASYRVHRLDRSDWIKNGLVLLFFAVVGVAFPNISLADKNSPYPFTEVAGQPVEPRQLPVSQVLTWLLGRNPTSFREYAGRQLSASGRSPK